MFADGPLYSILFEEDKEFYLERSFQKQSSASYGWKTRSCEGPGETTQGLGNPGLWNSFNLVIVGEI